MLYMYICINVLIRNVFCKQIKAKPKKIIAIMENRRDRWGRRQPRRNPSQRKFQRPKGIIDGADFINSMHAR